MILQYAPIQTGVSLSAETCVELHHQFPNITHIKVDAIPSGPMISRLQSLSKGTLRSIVGYMGLHLPEDLARGVAAVMPTVSVSGILAEICRLMSTDPEKMHRLHERILPLLNFMMQSVEMLVAVEKILLHRRGLLMSTYCRGPRCTLDSFQIAELEHLCSSMSGQLLSSFVAEGKPHAL
jgi:4-hydroxy-tetrahydrodipicolinate synthase